MRIRFGSFVLDNASRTLERDGEPVHLSPKAFEVLDLLIQERPRAVPKSELLDRVWPDVVVEEESVKNIVWEIRRTLGDPDVVRTVHKYGYAFMRLAEQEEQERATVTPARCWLQYESQTYPLTDGESYVGRDATCAVSLNVPGISRRHVRITVSGDSAVVEDLESKNGTRVRGNRIAAPTALHDGDTIHLGWTRVTFRARTTDDTASERSAGRIDSP